MATLHSNNTLAFLSVTLSPTDTSVPLGSGEGAQFPATDGGNQFYVTVEDRRLGLREIMLCTARSGDVLTVQRAQEGTLALAFSASTSVSNRLTSGFLNGIDGRIDGASGVAEAAAIAAAAALSAANDAVIVAAEAKASADATAALLDDIQITADGAETKASEALAASEAAADAAVAAQLAADAAATAASEAQTAATDAVTQAQLATDAAAAATTTALAAQASADATAGQLTAIDAKADAAVSTANQALVTAEDAEDAATAAATAANGAIVAADAATSAANAATTAANAATIAANNAATAASNCLALTGGTLTGPLTGTAATFGTIQINVAAGTIARTAGSLAFNVATGSLHDLRINNVTVARVDPAGTALPSVYTVLTAEKGDARYPQLALATLQTLTGPLRSSGVHIGADETGVANSNSISATTGQNLELRSGVNTGTIFHFYGAGGTEHARIEAVGTAISDMQAIVTLEKGDARYLSSIITSTPTIQSTTPALRFLETDAVSPLGRWRITGYGTGDFSIGRATAADFSTDVHHIRFLPSDSISVDVPVVGELVIAKSGVKVRMKEAMSTSGIAPLLYSDATAFYIMFTANNDANGTFNALRPFFITKATGNVTMNNGVTLGDGLSFGSITAASSTDLSKHIDLWGGSYGFCVTGSRLNYNIPSGAHYFRVSGSDIMSIAETAVLVAGGISLKAGYFYIGALPDGTENNGYISAQTGQGINIRAGLATNAHTIFRDSTGVAGASIGLAGAAVASTHTIITAEKGDARFQNQGLLRAAMLALEGDNITVAQLRDAILAATNAVPTDLVDGSTPEV